MEVVPSATLDVGATWGRGFGVSHPTTGTAVLAELGIGVEVRAFLVREVAVSGFAQLIVPFTRPRFVLAGDEGGRVFQPNHVGAVLGLGATLRAP